MTTTDNELDGLEIDDEEQTPPATPPEPPLTPEEQRFKDEADRTRALIESNARNATSIDQLVALGKQWLENQSKPVPPTPPAAPNNEAVLEDFGKRLNEAIIAGDGKQIAQLFVQGADGVTQQRLRTALEQFGTPLAEKAGEFTITAFLSKMSEEAGANGKKTHDLIAKRFALSPEERSWVATASAADTERFLRSRYEQSGGKLLIDSSRKARPQNLAPGNAGSGGAAGGGPEAIRGLTPRQVREQMKLMERLWPDEEVRKKKLKELQAKMESDA